MTHIPSHLQIITRAKWFILAFTVLTCVVAGTWAAQQQTSYKAVVAFDVRVANRATTPDYQYGAYYDLKGAEIFTQHLMSWFKTPAFVEDIYKKAGTGYTIDSLSQFTNRFQAKQYSAQNMVVNFSDYNETTANKLAVAVASVVSERANSQVTNTDQSQFNVVAQTPVVVASKTEPWMAAGVGLIAGFVLSLILVYIREYFRA